MTENDIKEELSYAYVHAVASRAGFACDRPKLDRDSVDIEIRAHGRVADDSILYSPILEIQAKATCLDLQSDQAEFSFDLPIKNYDDLRAETLAPRLLVVLIMPCGPQEWVSHADEQLISRRCAYWLNLKGFPASENKATKLVRIKRVNRFSMDALSEIMLRISRREDVGDEL